MCGILFFRNGGVVDEPGTGQFGAAPTGLLLFPGDATAVYRAYRLSGSGKGYPKDFPFDFPAATTLFREPVTFCADCTAGRCLYKVIFPEPPLAFFRVRVFRVYKIFHCPVKVQLATVNFKTSESTLFPVKIFSLFALQGFKSGVAHGYQVFFSLLSHIGNLPQFTHKSIIAGKTGKTRGRMMVYREVCKSVVTAKKNFFATKYMFFSIKKNVNSEYTFCKKAIYVL